MNKLETILNENEFSKDDLRFLLSLESEEDLKKLYEKAYQIKLENVGPKVYFRGIIEFSNICDKNCFYCGIRKDNKNVKRFFMNEDEIVKSAKWAWEADYGSIVMQSGERMDNEFITFVENALKRIKKETNGQLGITLSLGEQTEETYQRWYNAGAHRYLLRVESSNENLYKTLHPEDHNYKFRLECLDTLRKIGYQVGTGVMIGLPGQTIDDLVNDIIFFKENDIDMIGMGPYIVHNETPLAKSAENFDKKIQLQRGLKMIAVTRIFLKDVNMASTTALQALDPIGRELGLQAGANIVMPNITDTKYRESYQLYEDKPCLDENSTMCRSCLQRRVNSVGEKIGFGEWGDSPHYKKRISSK